MDKSDIGLIEEAYKYISLHIADKGSSPLLVRARYNLAIVLKSYVSHEDWDKSWYED